jgi:hypothetical protein
VADAPDPAELFDVEMQQVAGLCPLIALDGHGGFELPQPDQAMAPQEAGDGRGAELQRLGNLRPSPALPAQVLHPAHQQRRGGARTPAGPTRAISQAGRGFGGIAREPLAHGPVTHADGGGDRGRSLLLGQDPLYDLASTPGRRPGILMDVYPGLLLCGDGRSATTNVAETARMDNLLVVHI